MKQQKLVYSYGCVEIPRVTEIGCWGTIRDLAAGAVNRA